MTQTRVSEPKTLYHASRHPDIIRSLAPLSHLGTLAAAHARASSGSFSNVDDPWVYTVEITPQGIVHLRDFDGNHSWLRILDQLHYEASVIDENERDEIMRAAAPSCSNAEAGTQALCALLQKKRLDAIAYVNDFEDAGSTSWILVDPQCARIQEIRRLSEVVQTSIPSTSI